VIDKKARTLSAFDAEGNLVAFYPASIGSAEKPAPSGEFKVKAVAHNPTYHYDPRFAFQGVKAQHRFTIQPGPKNPVGLVWIDLTAPSYAGAGEDRQDRIAWLHPAHQLGRTRSRRHGASRHAGSFRRLTRADRSGTGSPPR
jgi:lipoprotein-anchoring transpeptidase ErfK/SrfK